MEQCPASTADNRSAGEEIPFILCDPKIHYHQGLFPWGTAAGA